jgi:hypothetical protein
MQLCSPCARGPAPWSSTPHAHTPTSPHAHTPTRPHAHTPTRPHAHTPTRPHAHTPTRPHAHTPKPAASPSLLLAAGRGERQAQARGHGRRCRLHDGGGHQRHVAAHRLRHRLRPRRHPPPPPRRGANRRRRAQGAIPFGGRTLRRPATGPPPFGGERRGGGPFHAFHVALLVPSSLHVIIVACVLQARSVGALRDSPSNPRLKSRWRPTLVHAATATATATDTDTDIATDTSRSEAMPSSGRCEGGACTNLDLLCELSTHDGTAVQVCGCFMRV